MKIITIYVNTIGLNPERPYGKNTHRLNLNLFEPNVFIYYNGSEFVDYRADREMRTFLLDFPHSQLLRHLYREGTELLIGRREHIFRDGYRGRLGGAYRFGLTLKR